MDLSRTLNLIDVSAPANDSVGACGSDGCGCGHGGAEAEAPAAVGAASTTVVGVTGMTCSHCASSVTGALSELPGVDGVTIELKPQGVSLVSIDASTALDLDAVRTAVAGAGYALAD
jgi:copper chaperone CopZ